MVFTRGDIQINNMTYVEDGTQDSGELSTTEGNIYLDETSQVQVKYYDSVDVESKNRCFSAA